MNDLPTAIHDVVVGSFNDALTPVFAMLIPMVLAGLVLAFFIKETPLRVEIEADGETEADRDIEADVDIEANTGIEAGS